MSARSEAEERWPKRAVDPSVIHLSDFQMMRDADNQNARDCFVMGWDAAVEPTPERVEQAARAMQRANRPDNDMRNRDQREADEDSSLPAYCALAEAALAVLGGEA